MNWWDQVSRSLFSACCVLSQLFHSCFSFKRLFSSSLLSATRVVLFAISEVIDISPGNFYSVLCFIQPRISNDVLCLQLNKQGDNIQPSFPNFESVCCSMSNSNCCFLTCIQISQEAGQMVQYSHLLKNFPQFFVIHTVKRLWYSQ